MFVLKKHIHILKDLETFRNVFFIFVAFAMDKIAEDLCEENKGKCNLDMDDSFPALYIIYGALIIEKKWSPKHCVLVMIPSEFFVHPAIL